VCPPAANTVATFDMVAVPPSFAVTANPLVLPLVSLVTEALNFDAKPASLFSLLTKPT